MEIKARSNCPTTDGKIRIVLQKILEPSFKVGNDVCLKKFLEHLITKNKDGNICQENTQVKEDFCQWIIKASNLWDDHNVNPTAIVLSFALDLASQLSVDEQIFVKLNCQNIYESFVEVGQRNSTSDPSVALGLVTLLYSFLEHKSGLQWVLATTYWTDVITLGLKAHALYLNKVHQFVIKLLEKTVCYNRSFAVNLVIMLIKPLKDVLRSLPPDRHSQPTQIESEKLFESLKPSLDMILEIVEAMLKRNNKNCIELFLQLETTEIIEKISALSQHEDFCYALRQIQLVFLFYRICERLDGEKIVSHNSFMLYEMKTLYDLIRIEMEKWYVRCYIKMCDYAHVLFCYLAPRMPTFIKKGFVVQFQSEMMFLQLGTVFAYATQLMTEKEAAAMQHEEGPRKEFYELCLNISSIQAINLCYKWIENVGTKPDLVDDCVFCLEYIKKVMILLTKQRAAVLLSSLIYCLTDSINFLRKNPDYEHFVSCMVFFKILVETIINLVESFDLTWKDSIETLSVMDLAYDYLQHPHRWNDDIGVINGLKLLKTAISKYMSPDMVLLIYNTEDSKVSRTGTLLYEKCHDSSWKIRDSALEVVYTLSLNANTKFPEYTSILLKADLPLLIVHMALQDVEYKVRATAFKCLQELIQIPDIWDTFLNMDTFLEDILNVFENEAEVLVRKEAVTLIYKIGYVQSFPEDTLPRLYEVMTHAAIGDLHWEVKYNALDFWFNLWEQHLTHEGMIDNTFPTHTFSKELKKIVALNEAEVRKRIVKVLNNLSNIGCLYVMKCAVKEDRDLEVSKKAISFTFNMLKMFKMYKITSSNVDLSQPARPTASPTSYAVIPASRKSLESPQFSNYSFFEPASSYTPPPSPSYDLDVMRLPASARTLNSNYQYFPEKTLLSGGNAFSRKEVQDVHFSRSQHVMPAADIPANKITSNISYDCEFDVFDYDAITCEPTKLETTVSSSSSEPVTKNTLPDELLKSIDMAIPQKTYDHLNQITNHTTQMKTKTYLAPSQYLQFVYNEVERLAMEKSQYVNCLDEFNSLLDDIWKEYDLVGNEMDCF